MPALNTVSNFFGDSENSRMIENITKAASYPWFNGYRGYDSIHGQHQYTIENWCKRRKRTNTNVYRSNNAMSSSAYSFWYHVLAVGEKR